MDIGTTGVHVYDRQTLQHYQNRPNNTINDELRETLCGFGLLRQPAPQIRPRLKPAAERGGTGSGARDYRSARTTRRESKDCCVFVFTETWLSDRVPDAAIQLDGLASFRADRDSALCAYRPLVRRSKPVLKPVRTWPSGAISALQDCFEHTDWQMFREAATYSTTTDLEEYTSSVTSYIGKCIDDVTVSRTITTRPKQRPWMTAEVRALLKARDSAFKEGDKAALRKARAKLSRAIREAKRAHGQSIHSHFRDSGDTRRMWQGIQAITNYRTTPPACDSDASLPDALNHFYARFETQNSVAARKTTPPPDDQVLCLTAADVRKTLRRVNPREAAGPDNIPGRELRECADQLTDVFTDIFNISLSSATVPTCLKATTIIPVPKKSSLSCLNDYRHVALTPIIMKCFKRLVMRHIKTLLPPSLEMVVDFRRTRRDHSPLHIDGSTVEIVKSTKFLGVHLAEDLTWSLNTSTITKKAQQRLYFLRRLRKAHLPPPILSTFYRGTIESILSSCITRKSLQRVGRTNEKIISVFLLTVTDIYTTRCICKANSIVEIQT
ncbi:hypothetical protein NFI96_029705, partial [Prochilodus magdalenae]